MKWDVAGFCTKCVFVLQTLIRKALAGGFHVTGMQTILLINCIYVTFSRHAFLFERGFYNTVTICFICVHMYITHIVFQS